MPSEDADIAVPILFILALIVGIGVYHNLTRPEPPITPQEVEHVLKERGP